MLAKNKKMVYNQTYIKGTQAERLALHEWYNEDVNNGVGCRSLVLIVHGYSDHMGRQYEMAHNLVEANTDVIAFGIDCHGHGMSDCERVLIKDFDLCINDLHLAVIHMKERHSLPENIGVTLIGHSMGGMISVLYYQKFKNADNILSLVLVAPLLGREHKILELNKLDVQPEAPFSPDVASRNGNIIEEIKADPLFYKGPFKKATLAAMVKSLTYIENHVSLNDVPVAWVHGDDDQLLLIEHSKHGLDHIKQNHYESLIFKGARHDLYHETNKQEIFDSISDYVERMK
ncbi:hypothetical protein PPL_11671 [Heterostelium album PN500]|uniref:Serine aminopeptidase S33 domain-containing protein n=1 Tax=Heterostelium pallidum (strain ATCC 26659 / Pp 5 / PN500) TaxID=670386 RepID=D3BVE5_HETP5|nr:hypothetical protein PPL_11671 [Heterostelium album PN500]EFA74702.1 hypothetical protein PPL_11671 [Heterostelium album PN500]|eukprot:XP_020426836.1 hypothetical protein PPL_11671 [Heterostelium album PN500]